MVDIICAVIAAAALIISKIIEVAFKSSDSKDKKTTKRESTLTNTLLVLILLVCLFNSVAGLIKDYVDLPSETTVPTVGDSVSDTSQPMDNEVPEETIPSPTVQQTSNPLADTPIGETLFFGSYQQDTITDEKRAIEWVVIKREENKVLLFSVMGLDTQQYNKSRGATCWASCSVHSWLNDTFYRNAFNEEEQAKIIPTPIQQDANPGDSECEQGPETMDNIFLLSASEYNELVYSAGNVSEEYRPGRPVSRIKKDVDIYGPEQYCWSLLRTSAKDNKCISSITAYGEIDYYSRETHESGGLIRPAIWVATD